MLHWSSPGMGMQMEAGKEGNEDMQPLPHSSPRSLFFTPITQDMFAWRALRLIHSDSFLFLPHVERNRNGVPRWKTLFTNVASACPAWSSGLFLLHYMAGNRS